MTHRKDAAILILTRRTRELIHIHVPGCAVIKVCVVEFQRGRARVGIDAPPGVTILREEIDTPENQAKGRQP